MRRGRSGLIRAIAPLASGPPSRSSSCCRCRRSRSRSRRASACASAAATALYFVIWWILLFAVLPFGAPQPGRGAERSTAGTEPGAPAAPALREKALWTTLSSAALVLLARGGLCCLWPGSEVRRRPARRLAGKEKARLSPCSNCLLAIVDPWLSCRRPVGRSRDLVPPETRTAASGHGGSEAFSAGVIASSTGRCHHFLSRV